jgi:hypothetical protein
LASATTCFDPFSAFVRLFVAAIGMHLRQCSCLMLLVFSEKVETTDEQSRKTDRGA